MPGKTATHEVPYAEGADKPPSVPTITKAMAEKIEALLSKGGDVTIAADGTVTIGGEKVTAGMLKASAVEEGKIKNDAVTAAKIAADAVGSSEIAAGAVGTSELAAAAKPVTWYTPKVIATEETRENVAFGFLTTEDKIENVVLPENCLIAVGFIGLFKSSVGGAGQAAIFVGANQLKRTGATVPLVQEISTSGTVFSTASTAPYGLKNVEGTSFVTTGQTLAPGESAGTGGLCYIVAAAGTYTIGVKFKATSGSVTAKERKLWVEVHGV